MPHKHGKNFVTIAIIGMLSVAYWPDSRFVSAQSKPGSQESTNLPSVISNPAQNDELVSQGRVNFADIDALLDGESSQRPDSAAEPAKEFLRLYPGVSLDRNSESGAITGAYGAPFSQGKSPEESAQLFVANHVESLFGTQTGDLTAGRYQDGLRVQPVMYEPKTGTYKFTLFYYQQQANGIPVFRSELRLLVRNDAAKQYPLVWAGSSLKPLGGYTVAKSALTKDLKSVMALAQTDMEEFSEPQWVVFAGDGSHNANPALAVTFVGERKGITPEKWRFVVDAQTGAVLYQEDLIIYEDIVGQVKGMATPGIPPAADICLDETEQGIPYAAVTSGSTTVYADGQGNFVLPHSGTDPVAVQSPMSGQFFQVYDLAGPLDTLEQTITPPGPANFLHNSANTDEFVRAQVNAYVQANVVRDFALTYNPQYPVIFNQLDFPLNVNIPDTCNAFYDGASLNFYQSGDGCPNTAFSGVIHHEYGHHLVNSGGSDQGQYGEGMGDTITTLIADNPNCAMGFHGNCAEGLRTADNNLQYPCNGEIHACGPLLSGAVWSVRNNLVATHPEDYQEILSRLTVNSILLHEGTQITPEITAVFLSLDDDDSNLSNGTPHFAEISSGFAAHNMSIASLDCNGNGLLDSAEIAGNPALDCNGNGILDECIGLEVDCNNNDVPDSCDIANGTLADANGNGIPDNCEADCNMNGVPDWIDVMNGTSGDFNHNGIPDECEFTSTDGVIYVSACSGYGSGTPDDPFCKIQVGINIAREGETVLVGPGFYQGDQNANLVFRGKGITLKSTEGPETCTIDGTARAARLLTIRNITGPVHIEGITFQNGRSQDYTDWEGGAILLRGVQANVVNCVFRNNAPPSPGVWGLPLGIGGAVCCWGGEYRISRCRFENNDATAGGAVMIEGIGSSDFVQIDRCWFDRNVARWSGGAFWIEGGTAEQSNSTVLVTSSTLLGNGAMPSGFMDPATVLNVSGAKSCTLENCTFFNNDSDISGSSAVLVQNDAVTFYNCILWDTNVPWEVRGVAHFDYNDILGDQGRTQGPHDWGSGNIAVDPQFFDPASEDLHLGSQSPCINTGDPDFVPATGETDIDGDPRVVYGRVDIGADEYYDNDCNDNGIPDDQDILNGTSQDCNANGIPDECESDCNSNDVPDSCDIADGTSQDCNSNVIPDECESDCNQNGVADSCDIAAGTSQDCNGNAIPDECDISSSTSLDCNSNVIPDECEPDCNNNDVPDSCDIANGTSLDCNGNGIPEECEFTDCNSNGVADHCDIADGTSQDVNHNGIPDECIAEIHVPEDFPTIQAAMNALFENGTTIWVAPGTYTGTGSKNLDFHGKALTLQCEEAGTCTIDCQQSGRGFYFHNGETNASIVDGFTIINGKILNATGGGIFCENHSSPTITRCTLSGNTTGSSYYSAGGGLFCDSSSPTITRCTISGNFNTYGGGIFCKNNSNPTITQCTTRFLVIDLTHSLSQL